MEFVHLFRIVAAFLAQTEKVRWLLIFAKLNSKNELFALESNKAVDFKKCPIVKFTCALYIIPKYAGDSDHTLGNSFDRQDNWVMIADQLQPLVS